MVSTSTRRAIFAQIRKGQSALAADLGFRSPRLGSATKKCRQALSTLPQESLPLLQFVHKDPFSKNGPVFSFENHSRNPFFPKAIMRDTKDDQRGRMRCLPSLSPARQAPCLPSLPPARHVPCLPNLTPARQAHARRTCRQHVKPMLAEPAASAKKKRRSDKDGIVPRGAIGGAIRSANRATPASTSVF